MRILLCVLGCTIGLPTAPTQPVKLTEDAPTLGPPTPGDITGRIAPVGDVALLKAVSRATGRSYLPDRFDRKSGRFAFRNLPGDAAYDVCIRTGDGRSLEGIDLGFVDGRLLRIASLRRKQLGVPEEPPHAFGPPDVKELTKYVTDLKDFMEHRRILYVRGHGRRATILVELMRTRDFHARKSDEVIWRIELWYFERHFGGWERTANVERVLERRRIPFDAWRKVHVEYYPELSVSLDAEGESRPVEFKIPPKSDRSRGRVAGTDVKIKTDPHVSGLDVTPPLTTQPGGGRRSASRPAPSD